MNAKTLQNRFLFSFLAALLLFMAPRTLFGKDCPIINIIEQAEKDYNAEQIQSMIKKSWSTTIYHETLVLSGSKKSVEDYSMKKFPLRILDLKTCETKDIVMIKRGLKYVLEDENFTATIQPFMNGQLWNTYNTNINISEKRTGREWVVVRNLYPNYRSIWDFFGKTNHVNYTPFSENLYNSKYKDALVTEGKRHLQKQVDAAYADLAKKQVFSRATPGRLVSDVIPKDILIGLPINEQADPDDFEDNSTKMIEKVFVLLGANKDRAYTASTSSADAKGLTQITPSAWKEKIAEKYPEAQLSPFSRGTRNQVESLEASALYFDNALYELYGEIPKERIAKELHLVLYASYNGGERRVKLAMRTFGDLWKENNRKTITEAKNRKNATWKEIQHVRNNKKLSLSTKKRNIAILEKRFASEKRIYKEMEKAQLRPQTLSFLRKAKRIWSSTIVFDGHAAEPQQ